jgi:hypothetical protein
VAIRFPVIGNWFRRPDGVLFEVVAVDEDDGTIEIQQFDGTIGEVEIENWSQLLLVGVSPPEDWSGSVDMDPEDYVGTNENDMPIGFHDPLAFLDDL